MTKKPGKTEVVIRTNFSGKVISDAMTKALIRFVSDAADMVAGAKAGKSGPLVGISSVFVKKSPPPSPVGQPPGVRTGTLLRSWRTRPGRKVKGRGVAVAGSNVPYARAHEYGIGVPERPYMQKGINSAKPEIAKRRRRIADDTKTEIAMKVRRIR